MDDRKRWWVVVLYALAMAWVEAAAVLYLRSLVNRLEPYQPDPFPISGGMAQIEEIREAATLVMLLTVGILAGRTRRSRLGYATIAFGTWDIFYYVFLKLMCGWPHSVMDWDILFLIPLPWWGPVLAPVLIAVLLILWGTLASQRPTVPKRVRARTAALAIGAVGVALGLGVFMADSIAAAHLGAEAVRHVLPNRFNWLLFCGALLLMSVPVLQLMPPLPKQPNGK
jgi:multisubunit Na+/H+ antiporter MnhG subunit